MDATIAFTVNGRQQTVTTDPQRPLLDVLREDLHLTGTKYGCGEARCGACTVLIDGNPSFSCRTPVANVAGKSVLTIEGLAQGDALHPVQEAFLAEGAFQCGYCTSGMIMATVALLTKAPNPSDEQILAALDGHLCRCCGYPKILKAVRRAAQAGRCNRVKRKDPSTGVGLACGTEKGSVVAACAEIAIRDGQISVLRICQAFECGAILNRDNLLSQVQGCIIMGLGAALREEMQFESGRITNASFWRYLVPRFRDVPQLDIHLRDRSDLPSAGAGETPIIAVAPAIANAVFHATGQRARQMPVRLPKASET